jgi:two-component system NtrC family response regulator
LSSGEKKLLIVEDDPGLQSQLKWSFEGYDVVVAGNREDAINELRKHEPPVVTLDLGLPPDPTNASEGFATLNEVLKHLPHTKVIVVTGNDDRENAVQSIALGAYDYYQKPIDPDMLKLIVDRAYELHELEMENTRLSNSRSKSDITGIVASSPEMMKLCTTIEKVAPTSVRALLLGESGTGKELVARAFHEMSARAGNSFVAINCAAIPEALLESELFGYEKGAFTGAAKQTKGKIEYAHEGTLFLDEVGDLPMSLQAKLLRFLQEKVIERVGGREEITVDVRVVCATHQNIDEQIKEGRFREDLYYRISEITLNIPPLRERAGDAVLLARVFLDKFSKEHGGRIKGFDANALVSIESYSWPGNVREMENKIKRAVIMAEGNTIKASDLELDDGPVDAMPFNLRQVRVEAEKEAIRRAINFVEGNLSQAAELLGVTRPTLYTLLDKYELK